MLGYIFIKLSLKETYSAHFQAQISILGYYQNMLKCLSARKTHQFSHTVQFVCSCPLIGQLTHTWASTTNNRTAVLNQLLPAKG